MEPAGPVIRRLGQPGDLGWVVMAHGEQYAAEFGWDTSFEALVARIVADFAASDDPRRAAWVAELEGRRVGCVFCVPADAADDSSGDVESSSGDADDGSDTTTAQLRILLVDPSARGGGLGGRLVDECIDFALANGFVRMRLWTNHPLAAARRVYLSRGFRLVHEEPHHSFGVDLVGQVYELDLVPAARRSRQAHAGAAGGGGPQ
jgi:GNAT superfamily N-acetyltransferase